MLFNSFRMHLKGQSSSLCNTSKRCYALKRGEGTDGRGHEEFLENEALSQGCWIMLLLSSKVWAAAVCVCV